MPLDRLSAPTPDALVPRLYTIVGPIEPDRVEDLAFDAERRGMPLAPSSQERARVALHARLPGRPPPC